MSKFSAVTVKALIASPKDAGFLVQRVESSHHFLRHLDGRTTVVPVHFGESIGPGLLAKILRDVGLTRSELEELLAYAVRPANNPCEWTGRHQLSAAPPVSHLPLRGSVREIGAKRLQSKPGILGI